MKQSLLNLLFISSIGLSAYSQPQSQQNQQMPQQQQQQPDMQGGKRRPPPEALQACAQKNSGDTCSFEGREKKTVEGTCFTPDSSKPLACKPTNPPPEASEQKK